MNPLLVRHVEEALRSRFDGLIDVTDIASASEQQRDKVFKTRALAAQALQRIAGVTPEVAAEAVTDGTGDNGIDAVYVTETDAVVLVQSKWDSNGTGSIGLGDARNFIAGLKALTNEQFDRFNAKLQPHVPDLQAALLNPDVTFVMVVATTGTPDFADEVSTAFEDMERELNDPSPLVRVEALGLGDFHNAITAELGGARIDLEVTIENWGLVTEPYEAYYGTVSAADVAAWYAAHGDRLFEQNIRKPLGNTTVNQGLAHTLDDEQSHFWYFNNGVTALCGSIRKLARGATTRTFGDFQLSGVSIVNGAQTVASIARAARERDPSTPLDARVWVRFISLEGCPPEFASEVTEATNTQNTVERSDFVALDPEQARLRTELLLSVQKTYSIKRGEETPPPEHGCTVTEATVALACAQPDASMAVIAKSAVGRLWESTERAPSKTLFNGRTSALRLWRAVRTMREVDRQLETRRKSLEGRERAVAVQGNRVALHLVFKDLDLADVDDPGADWDAKLAVVPEKTDQVLDLMIKHVEAEYAGNYITSLFKNAGRCERLVQLVRADVVAAQRSGEEESSVSAES
jgi:AIPR protein